MNAHPVSTATFEFSGQRISLGSTARFEASFPPIDPSEIDRVVAHGDPDALWSFFERQAPGVSFNVFQRLDQGGVMTLLAAQEPILPRRQHLDCPGHVRV